MFSFSFVFSFSISYLLSLRFNAVYFVACASEKDVNSGGAGTSGAGWTSWAVSGMTSLTSKIYRGKSPPTQAQGSVPKTPAAAG